MKDIQSIAIAYRSDLGFVIGSERERGCLVNSVHRITYRQEQKPLNQLLDYAWVTSK